MPKIVPKKLKLHEKTEITTAVKNYYRPRVRCVYFFPSLIRKHWPFDKTFSMFMDNCYCWSLVSGGVDNPLKVSDQFVLTLLQQQQKMVFFGTFKKILIRQVHTNKKNIDKI